MIVGVGGDKGAPGATTLAVTLAAVWPGDRVLAELDPRGADLPFRLHHVSGGPIHERPSIASLAVDARPGSVAPPMDRYAQPTSLGVPLIPGELSSRTMANLAPHMSTIAEAAAAWCGVVIADLGALLPGNSALALAKAAPVTLVVICSNLEGLSRLVERVDALSEATGDPNRTAPPVGVVVVTEASDTRAGVERASRLLAAAGSPAPVIGALPLDLKGVAGLKLGVPSRRLWKSRLFRAGCDLVDALCATWPELIPVPIARMNRGLPYEPPVQQVDGDQARRRNYIATASRFPALGWPDLGGQQR